MPFQISPVVNISEIDLTTNVPAVSTTECAIAAHLRWGPVEQRVLISSENELVDQFGKPNANTATDFFTAASFLAYGNALWVTRAISTTTTGGTAGASGNTGRNSITASANTADTVIKNDADYDENYSSGISGVGEWVAKYPGELGNSLKISACPSAAAWQSTVTGNVTSTKDSTTVTGANGPTFDTEIVSGDILLLGPDKEQVKVASVTNSSHLILSTSYTGNTSTTNTVLRRWEYFNNVDNAPGTSTYVSGKGGVNDEIHIAVVDEDGEFTGTVGQILEVFEGASMANDAKTENGGSNYYKNIINNGSKYVWWVAHDSNNTGAGGASTTAFAGDATPLTKSFVNGRDGTTPSNSSKIINYNLFNSPEEVDVSFILGSDANATIVSHLISNIAASRLDCIVCVSPERADVVNNSGYIGKEMDDVITFRDTLPSSSYGVMDSGWKYMYDKYNDIFRYVPLNGDVAGIMVRTDSTRDPWWSPAGYNRGNLKNVTKLAYNPSNKSQRDQLFKKGINPVVSFPGQGTVLFGDKTMLSKSSAFDAINVRRLFIVLEKAIATFAKFTLFEFNDDFTRAQFVNKVEPFLRDVQGRRGIIDFRVVCDETNNTAEVIDRNEFVGDIYIKPNRSIRTIQLNFVATRSGVDFEEIVGRF